MKKQLFLAQLKDAINIQIGSMHSIDMKILLHKLNKYFAKNVVNKRKKRKSLVKKLSPKNQVIRYNLMLNPISKHSNLIKKRMFKSKE